MVPWLHALLLMGCAGVPDAVPLDGLSARPGLVEVLYEGDVGGAATLEGFALIAQLDGALLRLDADGATTLQASGPGVLDATLLGEGAMIATDEGLYWLDDYLQDAALDDGLAPVTALEADGEDLWLRAQGLYRWQEGVLSALSRDSALDGPFAIGGTIEDQPVLWTSDAESVMALDAADWRPLESLAVPASSIALSAGATWVNANGLLYRYDAEGWAAFEAPGPVRSVWAHPRDPSAYILTDDTIIGFDGDFFELTDLPDGLTRGLGIDELGRLIVAGDGGLYRVSAEPKVAIVGLLDGAVLDGVATLRLLPNQPGATLSAAVDGVALALDGDTLTLDPYDFLAADEHTLSATASWDDGASAQSALHFTLGAPDHASWSGEIEPLYQDNCARCHGGSTQTVLDGREAWIAHIDSILTEVNAERMPLGGPPLSQAQIALIRVWRDGGFEE